MKFLAAVVCVTGDVWLDFGADLDLDSDRGIIQMIFFTTALYEQR